MHRAKVFFYVAAGIFLLALSYHLGARTATAQAPGNPIVGVGGGGGDNRWTFTAVAANGDAYWWSPGFVAWEPAPNVFGNPTPTQRESFGALKSRYRGERGAAQAAPQNR